MAAALAKYDWIIALISIAFCVSAFGNGANDVANSYATSVAARTLTMPQVGFLSMITEFTGAVGLGGRVSNTIKNGIISIKTFEEKPAVLILAMACAEFGSAFWLILATRVGFPVSTTQTIVGALIGVGYAAQSPIKWKWSSGSVSQIASSWAIAPLIAAGFSALLFATLKFGILERAESFKWAMRLIPFYLAFTCSMLALFMVVEAPSAPSLEEFGAGKAAGIVLGCFFGVLAIAYIFFLPYLHRRVVKNDNRLQWYHIPLGPTLWKDDPYIYFPLKREGNSVKDYYEKADTSSASDLADSDKGSSEKEKDSEKGTSTALEKDSEKGVVAVPRRRHIGPHERFLEPNRHLPYYHPQRLWGFTKFFFLQGVTRDCISHNSAVLQAVHARARHYDNRVEHLWTYCQVASAIMLSIAHGSNDVANAVGPWSAAYSTWKSGITDTKSETPIFILVVAGFLLGAGFWFYGYHIVRAIGNRITQLSPTRGYCIELGAAMTVLMASRLALPVSTTQCLIGATMGVALMNLSLGAVNWRQMLFILCGWILTLPCAALISGLLLLMALNTPHF